LKEQVDERKKKFEEPRNDVTNAQKLFGTHRERRKSRRRKRGNLKKNCLKPTRAEVCGS
jgi:hypothetical protein